MANSLLSKASSAVAACARRVSRATRRLLRARRGHHRDRRQLVPADDHHHEPPHAVDVGEAEGEEDGLWRRTILMGERCKPLDFPGVIHYDSFGRRLSAPPLARSGKAALLCRTVFDVDEAAVVAPRQVVPKRA
ncbi:hypothetical protein QOZ80_1BG0074210 [Eleusine coracana subsp. coracana]|nr:hypothetical protein QOZ80_1BG0074210 [Eleusine coracana subsp. coracana]